MSERNYDFRGRMEELHLPGLRDAERSCQSDEFAVTGEVCIITESAAPACVRRAAEDLRDFLSVSMEVEVKIRRTARVEGIIPGGIALTVGGPGADLLDGAAPRGFRADVDERGAVVTGCDAAGVLQGVFRLQEIMTLARGPFLPFGTVAQAPLFSPRMVHSGYGLDLYPDAHLAAIARAGMDSVLVFVAGVDRTPTGYLDFNGLCRRAAEWGLDVYAYSYLESAMHPDDADAEAYYAGTYGEVFRCCPGFKGVVLVGESVEFPSKDERTTGRSYKLPAPDGLPDPRPSPGWWPCRDYPAWLNRVKTAVRRHRPDADVVFWTYNWGYVDEKDRIALIESLPTDISLLATFEMFETVRRGDITENCVDYTLMSVGPGPYFRSEAKAAAERGIRLYSMTNTGGLTWDIGIIPYEPAPYRWMERNAAVLRAREEYGLCGLMESHHYGFWPSFISQLAKRTFTAGAPDAETSLHMLARQYFGPDCADEALTAWRHFSDGIARYLATNEDQYGPFRVGPAYPLVLNRGAKIPAASHALFGSDICFTDYRPHDTGRCTPMALRLETEIAWLAEMEREFRAGAAILAEIAPQLDGPRHEECMRQAGLGEFIALCAVTTRHTKLWYREKLRLFSAADKEQLSAAAAALREIALAEIENAEAAVPLVRADSRLGWEPSMEYVCDEEHLRWKIRQVRGVLEQELPLYE